MDFVFDSCDIIVPLGHDVLSVDVSEAEMLNFGFDFTDLEPVTSSSSRSYSDNDSIISTISSNNSSLSGEKSKSKRTAKVKKSTAAKTGSKLDKGGLICTSSSSDDLEGTLPHKKWAPNLSRKFRDLKLYAFPSFDKCDSLLFFPQSMSRHLNSGDYRSLVQLMNAHLHRNCEVRLTPNGQFSITPLMFVKLFEVMNDAHPDSVLCVHTTKVVENELSAKMYTKFTDSQVINNSMARTITDTPFVPMFVQDRSERFRDNLNLEAKSEEERQQLTAIVNSDVDLIVYGRIDFKLTFDTAKKIVGIDFLCEFTSLSTTEIGVEMDATASVEEL